MSGEKGGSLKVAGLNFDKGMKTYVLWTLKLMKDVPSIFGEVVFMDMTAKRRSGNLGTFDVIISDNEEQTNLRDFKDTAIIAFLRSK